MLDINEEKEDNGKDTVCEAERLGRDAQAMRALQQRCGHAVFQDPLSKEHGTYKSVKARFWPWLSD